MTKVGRRYIVGMAVDATGNGMYRPVSLLYFHFVTKMPLTRVGIVLTSAALLALISNPVAGMVIDAVGARASVVGGYLLRAGAFTAFPFVHNEWTMFAVLAVVALGDGSYQPSIQSFVAATVAGAERDKLIAVQRSLRNAGLGAGGLLASVALAAGTNRAFYAIVLTNAASFVVAAILIRSIPAPSHARATTASGAMTSKKGYRAVVRDRVFVGLTLANVPVAFGYMVLSVVLPVFVTQHLKEPSSLAGALYAVNTIGIAALQVPISRRLTRYRRTRVALAGGMVFVSSFLVFAGLDIGVGRPVLLAGVFFATAIFTVGELLQGATTSALAASAAPAQARGRYLAFYQFSWAVPSALAPAVLTGLLSVSAALLWLVLAGGVAAAMAALVLLEQKLPTDAVWPSTPDRQMDGPSSDLQEPSGLEKPSALQTQGATVAARNGEALPPSPHPGSPGRACQVSDCGGVQGVRL
ncbi:MAG TPA: MFS transporter [Acidimicrobiales bacterium]|nr:MFS transporter [Acidimicrobiales bacterium]